MLSFSFYLVQLTDLFKIFGFGFVLPPRVKTKWQQIILNNEQQHHHQLGIVCHRWLILFCVFEPFYNQRRFVYVKNGLREREGERVDLQLPFPSFPSLSNHLFSNQAFSRLRWLNDSNKLVQSVGKHEYDWERKKFEIQTWVEYFFFWSICNTSNQKHTSSSALQTIAQ